MSARKTRKKRIRRNRRFQLPQQFRLILKRISAVLWHQSRYAILLRHILFWMGSLFSVFVIAYLNADRRDSQVVIAMNLLLIFGGGMVIPWKVIYPSIRTVVRADPILSWFTTWISFACACATLALLVPPVNHRGISALTAFVAIVSFALLFYSAKRSSTEITR